MHTSASEWLARFKYTIPYTISAFISWLRRSSHCQWIHRLQTVLSAIWVRRVGERIGIYIGIHDLCDFRVYPCLPSVSDSSPLARATSILFASTELVHTASETSKRNCSRSTYSTARGSSTASIFVADLNNMEQISSRRIDDNGSGHTYTCIRVASSLDARARDEGRKKGNNGSNGCETHSVR